MAYNASWYLAGCWVWPAQRAGHSPLPAVSAPAAVKATTAEAAAGEAAAKATAEAPEQKALTSVGIETNGGRGGIDPDVAGSTTNAARDAGVEAPCGAGPEPKRPRRSVRR